MLTTYEQRSRLKLAVTVIAILVIASLVVVADHLKAAQTSTVSTTKQAATDTSTSAAASTDPASTTNATDSTSPSTTSATDTTTTNTTSSGYKDGTYSASSSYIVPHGQESIQVSLTIANGVITNASIQNSENDFDSAQYQEEFTAGYKNQVVGKKISGFQLSVIAGASDTTDGFNRAVSKISTEAQA